MEKLAARRQVCHLRIVRYTPTSIRSTFDVCAGRFEIGNASATRTPPTQSKYQPEPDFLSSSRYRVRHHDKYHSAANAQYGTEQLDVWINESLLCMFRPAQIWNLPQECSTHPAQYSFHVFHLPNTSWRCPKGPVMCSCPFKPESFPLFDPGTPSKPVNSPVDTLAGELGVKCILRTPSHPSVRKRAGVSLPCREPTSVHFPSLL